MSYGPVAIFLRASNKFQNQLGFKHAAKPPMETLHAGVLGRGLVGLGVHYIDLAFNGPSQEVTAGFFRTVIAANRLRFAK